MPRWISRVIPIEKDEAGRVWPVAAACFLIIAGVMIGRNVRDSLFLKNFGIANLPYMYAASAVLVVACSGVYVRLVDRLSRVRFLTGSFLLYAGLVVLSRALLAGGFRWFYPALYMLVQAIWILSVMQFWTAAGDLFDTREAKRIFPTLAAGGLLGMVAVGLVVRPVVAWLGTANLLVLWIGCLAGALLLLLRALRAQRPAGAKTPAPPAPGAPKSWIAEFLEGLRMLRGTRLLRAMAGITMALWVVFVVVDFQFSRVMNETYPTQDALTGFLGAFRGWAGLCSLVLQLLLTPWLVGRFGVGRTILIHPAALLFSTAGLLVSYGYATAFAAKFLDHVLLYTVQESSFQLLYNPLPLNRRGRMRAFIEGYFKPIMGGVAGLLLVAATRWGWSPARVTLLAVMAAGLWLLASYRVGGGYVEALVANLAGESAQQRASAAVALARLKDAESVTRLLDAIRGATPAQAVLAMQFIEQFGQPEAQEVLAALAGHDDPTIRASAVAALGRLRHPDLSRVLPGLLEDADARVRANALEAMPPEEAAGRGELLLAFLTDSNPRVRANAIRLLARPDGAQHLDRLLEACAQMCADPDPAVRQSGAYALGGLPGAQATPLLVGLLADLQRAPCKQALRALAEAGDESAAEAILRTARISSDARHHAQRALIHIHRRRPAQLTARLLELLRDPQFVELRAQVLRALSRIGDPAVLPELVGPVMSPDVFVRGTALMAAERLAERHPLPAELLHAVRTTAAEEIAALENMLVAAGALATAPAGAAGAAASPPLPAGLPEEAPGAWLAGWVLDEAGHVRRRIFRALGLLTDRQRMALIARQLGRSADPRERANALEALEYLAGVELARPLIRLIERDRGAAPASEGQRPLGGILAGLAAHPAAWIRAGTAFFIGDAGLVEQAGLLNALRHSASPLVREAALYSTWRLAGEEARPWLERAQRDPHPLVRASAENLLGGKTMLLAVEKVLFLKSVPLFASLEGDELASLGEISTETDMPAGAIVFRESDDAHNLYIVVSGRVRVFRGRAPRERLLAELGERECFGEMALVDEEPRSASVEALQPSRFLKIRGDDFRELILERPQIAFAILRLLTRRLRHMDVEAESQPVYSTAPEYV